MKTPADKEFSKLECWRLSWNFFVLKKDCFPEFAGKHSLKDWKFYTALILLHKAILGAHCQQTLVASLFQMHS